MPYNVLNLSTGELARDGESVAIFETPAMAAAWASDMTRLTGAKHQPRVVISDDWQSRERERFSSGEYGDVSWRYAAFWMNRPENCETRLHFAHRSKDKAAFVAFTESPEKGARDIQTRLRPGVYLKRYFGEILSDAEVTHFARLHAMLSGEHNSELKFATKADEIEYIYTNGPASCMSLAAREFSSNVHPVRVYGDSDLQLAYLEGDSGYHDAPIMARALVWPDRKIYGRVYPTPERYYDSQKDCARAAQSELISALESAGYQSGRFRGAKIQKIYDEHNGAHVMPYLDGDQSVDDTGNYFTIAFNGEYDATNTNGLLDSGFVCDHCEERASRGYENSVNVRRGEQIWCDSCVNSYAFYCTGTGEYYSESSFESVEIDGDIYSLEYAESHFTYCEYSEEWTRGCRYTVETKNGEQTWCESSVMDNAFMCEGTGKWHSSDDYESVEIDGVTYEREYAVEAGLLTAETETETETETESA